MSAIVSAQCEASLAMVRAADAGIWSALGPRRPRPYDWATEPVIPTDSDPTPARGCPASRGGGL